MRESRGWPITVRRSGSLTVITGGMFSGKTEELIRLVRRAIHARRAIQVFKPAMDTRSSDTTVRTHDGIEFSGQPISTSAELRAALQPGTQVVGIEEVQFLDPAIVATCDDLANQGLDVIVAGLDQDFRGLPFSFMPTLLAMADHVTKLHAICQKCGAEASRTQRLVEGRPAAWDDPIVLIGASESYEARCRRCHQVRRPPSMRPPAAVRETARHRDRSRRSQDHPVLPAIEPNKED